MQPRDRSRCSKCNLYVGVSLIACVLLLSIGNGVLPAVMASGMIDLLTLDTQAKLDALISDSFSPYEVEYDFLNLTNAYELQTVPNPPKPVFKTVSITFRVEHAGFDPRISADAATYSTKYWNHMALANPADAHLSIVTAHDILPTAFQMCGGESNMLADLANLTNPNASAGLGAICALMYDNIRADTLQLRPDGTTPNNIGMFVRRTIDELINGHVSSLPLFSGQLIPSMVEGSYNSHATLEALKEDIAAGIEHAQKYELSSYSGKGDSKMIGQIHSIRGLTYLDATAHAYEYGVGPISYTNAGIQSSSFRYNISGERGGYAVGHAVMRQPMPPLSQAPTVLAAGYPARPEPYSSSFTWTDFGSIFRRTNFSCGACTHELLNGNLYAIKYTRDDSSGWLTFNGVRDDEGACLSNDSCDYGMLGSYLWPGSVPAIGPRKVYSLPYFGKSILNETATFQDWNGAPLTYDEATMKHEMYIEPFSSKALKVSGPLMINLKGYDIETFDGPLYANVFSNGFPAYFPLRVYSGSLTTPKKLLDAFAGFILGIYLAMHLCNIIVIFVLVGIICHFSAKAKYWVRANHFLTGANVQSKAKCSKVKPESAKKKQVHENKLRLSKDVQSEVALSSIAPQAATMTIDIKSCRPPSFTINQQMKA